MRDTAEPSIAFIGVGSNVEPERNIVAALERLRDKAHVTGSSLFYRTEPIGRPDQPWFINGVWRIDTILSPTQIRSELLRPIEETLGRRRCDDKCAPRTIDLDLLLYDDFVTDGLPHADLPRPFVCVPVRELLDEARDIESGLRARMLALLPPQREASQPGESLYAFTSQLRQMLTS
ncbi:2-amino-4-hydroxy-6-hydroxymethyldihydropteridine diphosphokinase [Anaerobaca lacustris]|uniref:2-amino-4-hydroxy-6-hydroxymethyldihydropteridine pyrophosphokinase n=1 Tax=Anaerobaca lacustris TaxID=3044600 RepID=A0AAW6U2H0_9BACT|nr:2-amino-4-hydroxy-6-hydroxymethyldihydropteridine diphosphokinase [Sedimentisphaerales bacterium M17dextr]